MFGTFYRLKKNGEALKFGFGFILNMVKSQTYAVCK